MTPTTRAYFLRSPRLGFGVWSMDDLALALALWGDPRVTRLIGGPFSEEQVRARLAREVETQKTHHIQYWPLFRLSDHAPVGCCGLRPHPEEGVLELGFHLRPEHWGQGYAQEAARAAIAHVFGTLGVRALLAGHHPENADSKKLLERLGFKRVGEEHYPATGLRHLAYRLDAPY